MTTWSQLIENAWRDIRDADRCVALSITPAAHQLHRRLRQVTQAMEALLTDEAVERGAVAIWYGGESPNAPGVTSWEDGQRESKDSLRRLVRTILTAALEGE